MAEYKQKDILGKILKPGQTAINVFIRTSGGGYGESIAHRLCEIMKINPKSVRIRYKKPNGKDGFSNIFHTDNRLIILKKGDGNTSGGDNVIEDRWEILDFD